MEQPRDATLKSEIWRRHLFQQDKVTAHEERAFGELGIDFLSAKRVLDLGTGYGSWLTSLADRYPSCEWLGVDNDKIAIADAADTYKRQNVAFCFGDVETTDTSYATPGFDLAIAKLLVQHLREAAVFARHVVELLRSGGQLIVIDAYEPMKRFSPDVPTYRRVFHELRSRQDRARSTSLLEFSKVLLNAGFSIRGERILAGYTGQHFSPEDLLLMCKLNLEVVRDYLGGVDAFEDALQELDDWFAAPHRFASIGAYVLVAQKR